MTATNRDDQLGELFSVMINELSRAFGVSFLRFHCCGRHGDGLWPSWFVAIMVVAVMVCGHHGIGPTIAQT